MAAKVIAYEVVLNGVKVLVKDQKTLNQAIKANKKELQTTDFGAKKYEQSEKQLAGLIATQNIARKSTRQLAKEMEVAATSGADSYRALELELKKVEMRWQNLSKEARNSDFGKRLSKQARDLRGELKDLKSELGKNGLSGAFADAFRTIGGVDVRQLAEIGGAIALTAEGVRQLGRFALDSVNVFADFNRQMSTLEAISGATDQEMQKLKDSARELGENTAFTATQAAQLQIEYAKLGLGPSKVLASTADTLNLAALAQSELGDTATFVGATLKGFGLEVSEVRRVTDVAGKAFSSSALDAQKLPVALAQVAPVAKSAGVSLEQTVATLGILVDRGLDASTAGTGLRNIFLDLADKGLTLEEALGKINNASDSNAAALDLFGKRGAIVGQIVAESTGKIADLNQELENSQGFTARAAEKIQNDFKGSLDVLNSTIEGLKLNLIETFQVGVAGIIKGITRIVAAISSFLVVLQKLPQFLKENRVQIIALGVAILGLNANAIVLNATLLITNARTLASQAATKGAAIATGLWTAAQRALNVALKANPIGLVITAIGLLVAALTTAYQRSLQFRAALNGIGAVAKEVFTIVKEVFTNFSKGFSAIGGGDFKGALQAFGKSLREDNPISLAGRSGARLGKAYADAYKKTVESANVAAVPGGTKEAAEEAEKPIEDLTSAIKDLKEQTDGAASTAANFAKGSINQLNKELQDLKEKLDGLAPADQVGILQKVLKTEEAIADLKEFQAILREQLSGSSTVAPLPTVAPSGVSASSDLFLGDVPLDKRLEEIERAKLARIEAAKAVATTDEDFANRRRLIELEAQRASIQERLSSAETGTFAFLQLAQDLADKEAEINGEKNRQILEQEQARAQEVQAINQLLFSGLQDTLRELGEASSIRTANEIKALESRYGKEINLAEGNETRQEELQEELDAKKAAIEKQDFERQKRFQTAAALISMAQGIVSILASPSVIPDPFGTAFKALRIGFLTATTAAQIANINSRTAEKGILMDVLATGNIFDGRITGATHTDKSGGVPVSIGGQMVLAEHGERIDRDETGAVAIVNKRSSAVFRKELDAVQGKTFPGKRSWLSAVNNYKKWGIPYLAQGALIRPTGSALVNADNSRALSRDFTAATQAQAADIYAQKTAEAVEVAAYRGIGQGLLDANRRIEREQQLKDRTKL